MILRLSQSHLKLISPSTGVVTLGELDLLPLLKVLRAALGNAEAQVPRAGGLRPEVDLVLAGGAGRVEERRERAASEGWSGHAKPVTHVLNGSGVYSVSEDEEDKGGDEEPAMASRPSRKTQGRPNGAAEAHDLSVGCTVCSLSLSYVVYMPNDLTRL